MDKILLLFFDALFRMWMVNNPESCVMAFSNEGGAGFVISIMQVEMKDLEVATRITSDHQKDILKGLYGEVKHISVTDEFKKKRREGL